MIENYFIKNFLANVIHNPNLVAIEMGPCMVTYQNLFNQADLLVKRIKELQLSDQVVLGILSYRNYAAYISIVAAQLSGITFVPLNKNFPLNRNAEIIRLSGINCLIYGDFR